MDELDKPLVAASKIVAVGDQILMQLVVLLSWDTGTERAAHRKVDTETTEAEQITRISVDYGFFRQPADRAHNTLPVLVVLDRKSKALLADLEFMDCNS